MKIKLHWPKYLLTTLLLVLSYLLGGVVLSSVRHKKVSEEFDSSFNPDDCYSPTPSSERVLCIDDNTDALLWRLRVIETAKEEIILSTFELHDDSSGRDVMSALYNAADRGVHVRLIVDGISGLLNLADNDNFSALASHPNVEAKLYNPVNLAKPWRLTFRMHDKYLIADNLVYILGGRNTYDLFLGDYSEKPNIDRDMLVYETDTSFTESSLSQVRAYFESIWQLPESKPFSVSGNKDLFSAAAFLREHYASLKEKYPQPFDEPDFISPTIAVNKITLLTNPQSAANREPKLWHMLSRLMQSGENVTIQTPYVICSRDMYSNLTSVCSSASNVEIITNAVESGANPFGCTDYLNQKQNILKTGVNIYEFLGNHSAHVKTILIDNRLSIVGSYNLDMRSTYLDTEMMLAIDCEELTQDLSLRAESYKTQSKHISPDGTYEYGISYTPRKTPLGKKIKRQLLRVFIIPIRHML